MHIFFSSYNTQSLLLIVISFSSSFSSTYSQEIEVKAALKYYLAGKKFDLNIKKLLKYIICFCIKRKDFQSNELGNFF